MRTCIVLLNWNRWQDTIECLESLFRLEGLDGPIVVCDNDSGDESVERIAAWAEGRLDVWMAPDHPLRHLSFPPHPKPISCLELDREHAERGSARDAGAALVLIRTGGNLGFAGGNNVGLRYALSDEEIGFVWVLNNDTVVRPDALVQLRAAMDANPDVGICGSTLLYYDEPGRVQAMGGGTYNPWLALTRHVGADQAAGQAGAEGRAAAELSYVVGAAMLVRRAFLETVGLLSEEYFLYFEEVDWVLRAGDRFGLRYVPGSVVYHKEGRSIGTSGSEDKSWTSDYYFLRNRLLLTRRHFPRRLATVRLALLVSLLRRVRRRQWDRIRLILRLLREG